MDFGELLYAAQRNEYNNKKETKCYKTKFEPPKKEQKSQKTLSTNIQKFLARKEEEERQRQEEANRKREELLSLRAQDGKAKKRVAAMLKRTKAANKAAIADAVDNDNTAVTISGLAAQPDEDDYGYVSQEASAFYDKLLQKYHSAPTEPPMYSKKSQPKSDAKDLMNTKDRVRMALLRQEEEEMMPHKRKRKTKEEKLKEQVEEQGVEEQDTYEEPEPPPVEKPMKPKRPPAPPPLDFQELLKIAEKKQYEPVKIEPKVKQDEDERPMTKKQRAEYMKELEWRMRKEGKLPPLSSSSQDAPSRPTINRPQGASRPTPDQGFKRPADPSKGARPMPNRDNHAPNRSQQSADRSRPPVEKGNTTAMKSRPQNTSTERSRQIDDGYNKERNHLENGYKDRNRTLANGQSDRNRGMDERGRVLETNKYRSAEDVHRERARPSEDASRVKRQSEMHYKDEYRSSEKSQLMGKSRDRSYSTEMQRGGSGSEKKESSASSGQASIPRAPKLNNAQKEEQNSSNSFNGSNKFGKLQGNADGKVGKERSMMDLFGDDSVPVIKTNKNIPHSASDQKKAVISTNSKSNITSSYGKKLQESLAAKLEERERARTSSSAYSTKVHKPDSSGPSPAKIPKLHSEDNRGPKLQPRPVKGDMPRKEVSSAKPAIRPATMQKAAGAPPPKPQDGASKARIGNQIPPKASTTPMSSKDVKPKQFPPANVKPKQFPPSDVKSQQFPPSDVKPRQFPPSDVKPRQFPPPDVKPRQFPPPDVRRKQFPPADMRRRPKPPPKRRIEDSDEEYDSELDDFIDDGPQEDDMDYSRHIKEIFGYDKSRYADIDDGDECMESSFSQQLKEEFVSTKLGILEDLEDIRKEKEMEKRKKIRMMMKKRK